MPCGCTWPGSCPSRGCARPDRLYRTAQPRRSAGTSLLAIRSTLKGLNKLIVHREKIIADLDNNWAVVAEAIQTVLRREGYPNPYETLKALTRTNAKITKESIREFIDTLDVPENVKDELRGFSPLNYTGY